MPFTFSHPAIVLPFKYFPGKWRSMTGLIIGSIAPDFEKFFRMSAYDSFSHTWKSIFYFNLPLTLALAFLFHLVVRDTLIDHLPVFLQKRLIMLKSFDWAAYFRKSYGIVILSILVGVVSHIAWDAFTHVDGRFVRWFPALKGNLTVGGHQMKVYNVLQLGTSVLGLLIVLFAFFKLPALQVPTMKGAAKRKLRFWVVFTLIAFAVAVLRYVFGYHLSYPSNFIVVSISASLLSITLTTILFKNFNNLSRTDAFCFMLAASTASTVALLKGNLSANFL